MSPRRGGEAGGGEKTFMQEGGGGIEKSRKQGFISILFRISNLILKITYQFSNVALLQAEIIVHEYPNAVSQLTTTSKSW